MKPLIFASDGDMQGKLIWDLPQEHYWWTLARTIREHANAGSAIYFALRREE